MCLSLKPTMAVNTPEKASERAPDRAPDRAPFGPGILSAAGAEVAVRKGSLRTKIWDLPSSAHCPVIGVCLSLVRLQTLLGKAGHRVAGIGHYEQHQIAVSACRKRSRLAEIVQQDLDRQFQLTLQNFKSIRDEEVLSQRWAQARASGDWVGVFWVILTHPFTSRSLSDGMLGDVHMLQHQVGMASRIDQQQAVRGRQAQEALQSQMAQLQTRWQSEQQAWQQRQKEMAQELSAQRTLAQQAQGQANRLQAQLDAWLEHHQPNVDAARMRAENLHLRDTVALLEKSLRRENPAALPVQLCANAGACQPQEPKGLAQSWHWLKRPCADMDATRRVVCVGGMPAQIPLYRQTVESAGISFAHHDGGMEHKLAQLDHCLAQADLVICQTGCISHNAYWRVKDHCKRTGKACVFVFKPSIQVLQQLMQDLGRRQA